MLKSPTTAYVSPPGARTALALALLLVVLQAGNAAPVTTFSAPLAAALPQVMLATFNSSKVGWQVVNDPVMGGRSKSTFAIQGGLGVWKGEVAIVPSLKAPGFCNLETTHEILSRFPDVSDTSHLLIHLRTANPEYQGYKFSFAAGTLNPQFASFKANFNVTGTDWTTVAIKWDQFSNNWSSFTGDCDTKDPTGVQHYCCSKEHPEVCPTAADLTKIQALGFWTEGAAGPFNVQIAWIGAGTPPADPIALVADDAAAPRPDDSRLGDGQHNHTCQGYPQKRLRYNVSGRLASGYLPFPTLPLEGLAEAVCCDSAFVMYAEPQDFFNRPDVDLFAAIANATGPVTFYDSVCGLPVFRAPVNRSLAAFKAESLEHHWPSFRTEEIVAENIITRANGEVVSRCGTHLGSNLPDAEGDRYCIDLSCISGNSA